MSEELDEIVDNLREPSAWVRILFMLGFALLLYLVLAPVILVLTFVQALFSIFAGEDNYKLRGLGAGLTKFVSQILGFLTYNSEVKPFPFADFPEMVLDADGDRDSDNSAENANSDTAKVTPAADKKKPAKKKTSSKKTSPKKKASAEKKQAAGEKSSTRNDEDTEGDSAKSGDAE